MKMSICVHIPCTRFSSQGVLQRSSACYTCNVLCQQPTTHVHATRANVATIPAHMTTAQLLQISHHNPAPGLYRPQTHDPCLDIPRHPTLKATTVVSSGYGAQGWNTLTQLCTHGIYIHCNTLPYSGRTQRLNRLQETLQSQHII